MANGVIYGVRCNCHPEDGVRYVGQTSVSVNSRKHVHLWNSRTESSKSYNSHFSNWIRLHGEENVEFYVIEEVAVDLLNEREAMWIAKYRREGQRLTNIKEGGLQARGHKNPSQSSRMMGANNPNYGTDRRELMAYARSFQGAPSEKTRELWREQRKGVGNPRSKMTDDIVRELRLQPRVYGLFSDWGRRYGVSPQSVYLAYIGKTWKHVT